MSQLAALLLAPLSYPFMVRSMLAAIVVGAVCAVVGCYVVLRGMAFLGDALAHAILPGLALGYILSGRQSLFWWALGTATCTALAIGILRQRAQLREDTAIGVVFAAMFALGIALISTTRTYAVDLAHILFGNVLGITGGDLVRIGVSALAVLGAIFALYRELLIISFDRVLALTLRLNVAALEFVQLVLISTTVVISLQTVGVALMVAMLVTPAAAAYLVARRLPQMMALAAAIGSFSGVAGLYLSYYVRVASGAAIVLVCTAIFLAAFALSPRRRILRPRGL
jgi:manganese/iron transport system permease protein